MVQSIIENMEQRVKIMTQTEYKHITALAETKFNFPALLETPNTSTHTKKAFNS